MARFGVKLVFGSRAFVGAKSQPLFGSLYRENGFRESCIGGSDVRSNLANAQRARCFS